MTDENQKLTPARPVAPRRKLPANPRMAQPIRKAEPERTRETDLELESPGEREVTPQPMAAPVVEAVVEPQVNDSENVVEVAPPAEAFSPVQAALGEVAPEPAPVAQLDEPAPAQEQTEFDFPKTIRETLRLVDQAWATFRAAAMRFPSERMDERLGEDAWTRKQMLEHIAAWHDLTADRLVKMINSGRPEPLDRATDAFNAAVARQAIGKTSGEVLKDMDATFNRLRRQMARLTDTQLKNDDWWAAFVIGGNTYGHYEQHFAEIYTPELPADGRSRRR